MSCTVCNYNACRTKWLLCIVMYAYTLHILMVVWQLKAIHLSMQQAHLSSRLLQCCDRRRSAIIKHQQHSVLLEPQNTGVCMHVLVWPIKRLRFIARSPFTHPKTGWGRGGELPLVSSSCTQYIMRKQSVTPSVTPWGDLLLGNVESFQKSQVWAYRERSF